MITYSILLVGDAAPCYYSTDRYSVRLDDCGVWVTDNSDPDSWTFFPWCRVTYVKSFKPVDSDS